MSDGDGFGRLLRSMLGAPDPQPGPPFTHVHAMPETEEEIAAQPYLPTMTVEHGPRGRPYENGPLAAPAAFRRLSAEMLTDTGNVGCYFPLTDTPTKPTPPAVARRSPGTATRRSRR